MGTLLLIVFLFPFFLFFAFIWCLWDIFKSWL